jgi:hypothetical protein
MDRPHPPPWIHNNNSYSSLLAGMEVGLLPGQDVPLELQRPRIPRPASHQSYVEKPLPPIPLRNPRRKSGRRETSSEFSAQAPRQKSSLEYISPTRRPSNQLESLSAARRPKKETAPTPKPHQKTLQILGNPVSPATKSPSFNTSSKKVLQLTGHNLNINSYNPSPNQETMRDSGVSSMSTGSFYSEPGDSHSETGSSVSDIAHVVDSYSKWGSWAPVPEDLDVVPSPHSPAADETAVQPFSFNGNTTSPTPPRINCRPSSSSVLEIRFRGVGTTPDKAMTLDELIAKERERFEAEDFCQDIWHTRHSVSTVPIDLSPTEVDELANCQYPVLRPYPDNTDALTPYAMSLAHRPKTAEPRIVSRFSDHSDDGGIVSAVRESVLTGVRTLSSPFSPFSKPPDAKPVCSNGSSAIFRAKFASSVSASASASTSNLHSASNYTSVLDSRAASPTPSKRKRGSGSPGFGTGKHPLKSPFPFPNPLSKRVHVEALVPMDALKMPPPPPSIGYVRRISNAFQGHGRSVSAAPNLGGSHLRADSALDASNLSSSNAKMNPNHGSENAGIAGIVIPDHNRVPGGPDTPRPSAGKGFMSSLGGIGALGGIIPRPHLKLGEERRREKRRRELRESIRVVGEPGVGADGEVGIFF